MAKVDKLYDHLPSLYRPEADDSSLLNVFLQSTAQIMEELNSDMSRIMQAHWFSFSDSARYDDYANLDRNLRDLPPLDLTLQTDRDIIDNFPYLFDLARMGSLMSLPIWREPAALKEGVEEYRRRLKLYVELYKNGLGTLGAIRTMVEGMLPPLLNVPYAQRSRAFSIEEFSPLKITQEIFKSRGAPFNEEGISENIIGPLMRWTFENTDLQAAPTTAYIEGMQEILENDEQDATLNPMLELFALDETRPRIAIAYEGTLAAQSVLRLRPAYTGWLALNDGVQNVQFEPSEPQASDVQFANPQGIIQDINKNWNGVPGAPQNVVTVMLQSEDKMLWLATDNAGAGELWRYNGDSWLAVLDDLEMALIHTLVELEQSLLIATSDGLLRMPLYPADGDAFAAQEIASLNATEIFDILIDDKQTVWLATSAGVQQLAADDSLQTTDLQATDIYTLHQSSDGILYAGGELGLFQFQLRSHKWYWYRGRDEADQIADWVELSSGELPALTQVYLPVVLSITAAQDSALWLGTSKGFARYYARSESSFTYKTVLEAYPDLVNTEAFQVKQDSRGLIWFCTQRGVFRYDGRDLAQYQSATQQWVSMGRADGLYMGDQPAEDRGAWRFNNTLTEPGWEFFDYQQGQWSLANLDLSSAEQTPVRSILWTDSVSADLGNWDEGGDNFVSVNAVPLSDLRMRFKPNDERIVDGGLVAVPRMPRGKSTWRYLSLETAGMPMSTNSPWWTREGRSIVLDESEPYVGRYREVSNTALAPEGQLDQVVFSYNPAAKIKLEWAGNQGFAVTVRLQKNTADEFIHSAILDRVWQGMQKVRPAGVQLVLAIEQNIVRGETL